MRGHHQNKPKKEQKYIFLILIGIIDDPRKSLLQLHNIRQQ
jgi:hypothetical protein